MSHSPTLGLLGTATLVAVLSLGARIVEPGSFPGGDGKAAAAPARADADASAERGDPRHALRITAFARRYDIEPQLSRQIYEAARAERVSPALAFGLVLVESAFDPSAVGSRGSVGLTQLQPRTAREMAPRVRPADLYIPTVNLRLGFRYLHTLLDRFDQDVTLALAAYNRGPAQVEQQVARGRSPGTAYARKVLRNVERGSAATL